MLDRDKGVAGAESGGGNLGLTAFEQDFERIGNVSKVLGIGEKGAVCYTNFMQKGDEALWQKV